MTVSHKIESRVKASVWPFKKAIEQWFHMVHELFILRGAGMAQWLERSPQIAAAWVWFLDPVSHVGWVCCWFSSLLWGIFSGLSGFPPSTKINTSKFQFDLETVDEEPLLWKCHCKFHYYYLLLSLSLLLLTTDVLLGGGGLVVSEDNS